MEEFLKDMREWLSSQDRNGDYENVSFEGGIDIAFQWACQEVLNDVREGTVPASVASFSELHDHVDANGYGGAFDWPASMSEQSDLGNHRYTDLHCRFWNTVQNRVDAWIKSGKVREVPVG